MAHVRRRLFALTTVVLMIAGFGAGAKAATTFEGTLQVVSGDSSDFSEPREAYFLRTADGTTKTLVPVTPSAFDEPVDTMRKKQVIVDGVQDGDTIRVTRVRRKNAETGPGALQAEAALTGSQKFASVLCKFSDVLTEPHFPSYYSGLQGTAYPGLDHYWRNQSYNNINLTGSVVTTWVTLPKTRAKYFDLSGNALLTLLMTDCTRAGDSQVFYPDFVGINTFYNDRLDCCAWGGGAYVNLDGENKLYKTTWIPPWAAQQSVLGHEMGHAFGFPHSSGPYAETYDSQWDIMSDTYHNLSDFTYGYVGSGTISYHRDLDGWIPASRKFTPAAGTTTTIKLWPLGDAVPTAAGLYQMAQIPITASTWYTIETRRLRGGYDDGIPAEGVLLHTVDPSRSRDANVVDATNDNNPNDAGAIWVPGESYSDFEVGLRVDVLASNADGSYDVRISYKAAGVIMAQTDGATEVAEGGAIDTVSVRLWSQPKSNVTLSFGETSGQVTTSPAVMTFTSANWFTPQTVTVAAFDDSTVEESPHFTTITTVVSSADAFYNGVPVDALAVSIADNDENGSPPETTFTTGDGSIFVAGHYEVNGMTVDTRSSVSAVLVTMTPVVGAARAFTAEMTCTSGGQDCFWFVPILSDMTPGIYAVNARGTDSYGNMENPGPSITIFIL